MSIEVIMGLLIPFIGTLAGSSMVFFLKKQINPVIEKLLIGFAAGVMTAASVWSLLIPAMDQSSSLGKLAFLPAAVGYSAGTLFLLILDEVIPHLHAFSDKPEGPHSNLSKTIMMVLAVVLHNIPEGMAVGVVYAGWMSGNSSITFGAALSLAVGIAIQNFPEGAIVSMPLRVQGSSKKKAFGAGVLSGIVEPIGGLLTIVFAEHVIPLLPYLLSFAAGAMMYVVIEELVPEMSQGEHSHAGVLAFAAGFCIMMILDVALG